MEVTNHSWSYTISHPFPLAKGRALNNMAAGMEVTGHGEKLGQSAIGIALYQRPVVRPTFLDPTRV